ncbi:hypothetical protein [Thermosporothrix hazakensis]|uniref:hypothetical protein n=1 Tax=Thermosporothrix hazakensis TaxID=644383 RepID=UPI0011B4C14A|nr:hypothetical protein [Thermosporothrix hazakensis]
MSIEATGWVQIHAGAIALPSGGLILFVGEKEAGKTSSVLGLCRNIREILFVSNDRILLHKEHNCAIGWPTAIGIGKEALRRLYLDIPGYEARGKIWYWPSEIRSRGFLMKPHGIVQMIVAPQFTLNQHDPVVIKKLPSNKILAENIRYDALSEENWWNLERPNKSSYGAWLASSSWVQDIPAIQIRTCGLSSVYI